jgi:hypothetical protein
MSIIFCTWYKAQQVYFLAYLLPRIAYSLFYPVSYAELDKMLLLLVQFYIIYELLILTIDVSLTLFSEPKHMISWLLGVYSICCYEIFVACIVSVRSESVKYYHIVFTYEKKELSFC